MIHNITFEHENIMTFEHLRITSFMDCPPSGILNRTDNATN